MNSARIPRWAHPVVTGLRREADTLMFVLKTALAAILALWIGYRLALDSPQTAVVTVFIVMQARTGLVVAKGFYRALGTVIGSGVSLLLVATFAQDRFWFLAALALWIGALTAGAAWYRNFQSYAFVLAGYTACLVGLPAALDPGQAFEIAVTRLTEVLLGITVASVISGLIAPVSMRGDLIKTAQARLTGLTAVAERVITGGLPTAQWGALHLTATQGLVAMTNFRAISLFADGRAAAENRALDDWLTQFVAAASTLQVLNRHQALLARPEYAAVADWIAPAFLPGVGCLSSTGGTPREMPDWPALAQWAEQLDAWQRRTPRPVNASPDARRLAEETLHLLRQWLHEFRALGSAHTALLNPYAQPTPLKRKAQRIHRTDYLVPLAAGIRAVLVLIVMSAFWLGTAWPTGPLAVTIAVVVSALFATAPNPTRAVGQMGQGIALALIAAVGFQFGLLPALSGFTLLVAAWLPFLLATGYLMASPRFGAVGVGFGLFFSTLALPANLTVFDPAGLLNNGIGLLLAVAVAGLSFVLILPTDSPWFRHRLRAALDRELVRACTRPLAGLRGAFERDTRELVRQLATLPGVRVDEQAQQLEQALRLQTLGRAAIELRQTLHAPEGEDTTRLAPVLQALAHQDAARLTQQIPPLLTPGTLPSRVQHYLALIYQEFVPSPEDSAHAA
ncbi:FUSC family protein [Halothiobacillus sp. DCM-1]|uniref:FUSC family protein n=1 Tax=Halothiobacillus sp. DCM-1 TaxID=3112558 RepID=UPI00324DBAFA